MIVRVLQPGDSKSGGELVHLPGMGLCQICDDAALGTPAQLATWLASARAAAAAASLLARPRLQAVKLSPDTHVYLALDANGKVAAQITAS